MMKHGFRPRAWLDRARDDIASIESSDALLALILEYEGSCADERDRDALHEMIAHRGCCFDRRAIDHLCTASNVYPSIAWNRTLTHAAAERLAAHLSAVVARVDEYTALGVRLRRMEALKELVRRFRLSSALMPKPALFSEAPGIHEPD